METPTKNNTTVANFSFILDDEEMLECFLNLPAQDEIPFALDLQQISQGQNNDPELLQRRMQHPMQYPKQQFGDIHILSFQPTPESRWKICIPTQQLENITNWFHTVLNRCGFQRLLKTLNTHMYHPKLRATAE